jgi:hypothetical protein
MKKSNAILFGLLVLATGLVLMGCSSLAVWDKSVQKDETAILYYEDTITLIQIDGVANKMGPLDRVYPGKTGGNILSGSIPKAILRIPAGQHAITVRASNSALNPKDVSYNFAAGRKYQVAVDAEAMVAKGIDNVMTAGLRGDYEYKIIDVTGEKWAK